VLSLPAVWADLDVRGPAHDLPPDKAAATALLAGFLPKPSAVVDSGHGYHAYWFLAERITEWLAERCERHPDAWLATTERYRDDRFFCKLNGEQPIRRRELIDRLSSAGLVQNRRKRARGTSGLHRRAAPLVGAGDKGDRDDTPTGNFSRSNTSTRLDASAELSGTPVTPVTFVTAAAMAPQP
jgi:hypothetical protein